MVMAVTNAAILAPQTPAAQLLPAPTPPKPRRKARVGELNRLVHRAIDRRNIDLVDVIADEIA